MFRGALYDVCYAFLPGYVKRKRIATKMDVWVINEAKGGYIIRRSNPMNEQRIKIGRLKTGCSLLITLLPDCSVISICSLSQVTAKTILCPVTTLLIRPLQSICNCGYKMIARSGNRTPALRVAGEDYTT
ncbi:hypothetical protein BD560DRAFT_466140 [Blakeslea trispora]|nr:hypothetical protein BD560DRAFT_466140 [Blakeslea trispora]